MKNWRTVCPAALVFTVLCSSVALPVFGQLGVGFGGWGGDYGSRFGAWVNIWPGRRCCGYDPAPRQKAPKAQSRGLIEGTVTVRPGCASNSLEIACPLLPDASRQVIITAQPYGSDQWLSIHANTQGQYHLPLPPGGYNVTVYHPELGPPSHPRQIIIQPGQTNHQDFQIDIPVR